jgi:hypothetical protein
MAGKQHKAISDNIQDRNGCDFTSKALGYAMLCHVMSCYVTLCHANATLCHVTSRCHVMSCYVILSHKYKVINFICQ